MLTVVMTVLTAQQGSGREGPREQRRSRPTGITAGWAPVATVQGYALFFAVNMAPYNLVQMAFEFLHAYTCFFVQQPHAVCTRSPTDG